MEGKQPPRACCLNRQHRCRGKCKSHEQSKWHSSSKWLLLVMQLVPKLILFLSLSLECPNRLLKRKGRGCDGGRLWRNFVLGQLTQAVAIPSQGGKAPQESQQTPLQFTRAPKAAVAHSLGREGEDKTLELRAKDMHAFKSQPFHRSCECIKQVHPFPFLLSELSVWNQTGISPYVCMLVHTATLPVLQKLYN